MSSYIYTYIYLLSYQTLSYLLLHNSQQQTNIGITILSVIIIRIMIIVIMIIIVIIITIIIMT